MLNLLKFRQRAVCMDRRPDDASGCKAYLRYADAMQRIVESAGGWFLFTGPVHGLVIGEVDEFCEVVALVEYPTAIKLANQKIHSRSE
jgi:hypothetical protein